MKCDTPARERGSSRDPVAIQSPSAAERTPGAARSRRAPAGERRDLRLAHGGDRIRGARRPTFVAIVMNRDRRVSV